MNDQTSTEPEAWEPQALRAADLGALTAALQDQSTRRRDLVIPARAIRMDDQGMVQVPERTHDLTLEGVTETVEEQPLQPLDIAHADLSERLDIPRRYYRRMLAGHSDLLAANVNRWLDADERTLLLRTFTRDGDPSLLRAVLSDRYSFLDNWDVILATLEGLRSAGVDPAAIDIGSDLTERRMRVRITAPQVALRVDDLLGGYTSPFTGERASELPMMWAGLEVANSETGGGAFTVTPRVVLQVCRNGMTRKVDLMRAVHLGGRMEEGVIRWSEDTQRRTLELVTARTRDAVQTFMSTDYLQRVRDDLAEVAGVRVPVVAEVLEAVSKQLGMSQSEESSLLEMFVAGADPTALGVGHAVTAMAQGTEDSERAADLEASFFDVVGLAAAASTS